MSNELRAGRCSQRPKSSYAPEAATGAQPGVSTPGTVTPR